MDTSIFTEISLILVIAALVAGVMQWFKQPLIIGHIITGIIVSPALFNLVKDARIADLFSHIGVALLLFIIGLGLNPRVIKEVGKVALVTGVGQILFTAIFGFGLAHLFGFASIPALYIAIALTFSSTIIVLKLLSDKKEVHRLYGKIATGLLLVQDVVAVLILVFVSSLSTHSSSVAAVVETLAKGGLVVALLWAVSVYLLPKFTERFAHSQEYLFLFSIGWGFGIASLFAGLGFSIEIGALAAGVALATSKYAYEISSRMRPLRDFFIILFFIVLGSNMHLSSFLGKDILIAIAFSLFVLLAKPLVMLALMGRLGYRKKTSFKAGLTVAQISEFSLILILLGYQIGQLTPEVVSILTLVALITIAASTYMMLYDDRLYIWLEPFLGFFERKDTLSEPPGEPSYDVILFGYKSGGSGFVRALEKLDRPYLVVDYDPETIDHLQTQNVSCLYGDANDPEFLAELNLAKVRLVIINLTDFGANMLITSQVREHNKRALVIAMTKADDKIEEALDLYDRGASYVMMPRYLSSLKVGTLLKHYELSHSQFKPEREKHKRFLKAEPAV